jgi:hypothetical protein
MTAAGTRIPDRPERSSLQRLRSRNLRRLQKPQLADCR